MTEVRTGLFKYVRHDKVHEFMARGWFPVSDLGRTHGYWSVLMWRCDCPVHIPLTRGYVAVIDAEDQEAVARYKWTVKLRKGVAYAARQETVDGVHRTVYLHRFLMGEPPGLVDHRDRDGLNCRRGNLRNATVSQNQINTDRRGGVCGYRGVYQARTPGKFRAQIGLDRKQFALGQFDNAEDAARAYDAAAAIMHGEFARLNFSFEDRA